MLGANAGYVGYEEGGLLTEFVRENPNCVVLFDEIEKCDAKILDVLLHILDEGYATDNLNRKIDFTGTVIIMTSNIGTSAISSSTVGFSTSQEDEIKSKSDRIHEEINKYFRPEFLNRIDDIVVFNSLIKMIYIILIVDFYRCYLRIFFHWIKIRYLLHQKLWILRIL